MAGRTFSVSPISCPASARRRRLIGPRSNTEQTLNDNLHQPVQRSSLQPIGVPSPAAYSAKRHSPADRLLFTYNKLSVGVSRYSAAQRYFPSPTFFGTVVPVSFFKDVFTRCAVL